MRLPTQNADTKRTGSSRKLMPTTKENKCTGAYSARMGSHSLLAGWSCSEAAFMRSLASLALPGPWYVQMDTPSSCVEHYIFWCAPGQAGMHGGGCVGWPRKALTLDGVRSLRVDINYMLHT